VRAVTWLAATFVLAASLAACGGDGPGESQTAGGRPEHLRSDSPEVRALQRRAAERRAAQSATTPAETPATTAAAEAVPPAAAPRPAIVQRPIPFGPARRAEMRAYAERHYGLNSERLADPHVIVIHFTANSSFSATYNTFAADVPDVELHELPGVCSHFVIDRDGTIYQLVSLGLMCRHTVGLNDTAIGIEHVGTSAQEVLGDPAQLRASLRLTEWLRCRYGIDVADVIGHNESLSSPYHHERVARLRTQTHADFNRAEMDVYRARLQGRGGC
jgi:beta-N-acetylhexosaminidase